MAKTINLGKVGITLGGDYDSSKNYASKTTVFYNYVSWTSKKDVPAGIAPGTNDEYWQKISERGEKGEQGDRGPQGNSAFDGTGVEIVNNLTQGGEAAVLSAEQGKILDNKTTSLSSLLEYQELRDDLTGSCTGKTFKFSQTQIGEVSIPEEGYFGFRGVKLQVNAGDSFIISGLGGDAVRLYCFVDNDNVIQSIADSYISVSQMRVSAEKSGYFYCNFNPSDTYSIIRVQGKSAVLNNFSDRIDKIEGPDAEDIKKQINQLHAADATVENILGYESKDTDLADYTMNGYWLLSSYNVGETVTATKQWDSSWRSIEYQVKAGEKYRITGQGGASARLYALLDSNAKLIEVSEPGQSSSGYLLSIKKDGVLYCSFNKDAEYSIAKVEEVYSTIHEIEVEVKNTSEKTDIISTKTDKIEKFLGYEIKEETLAAELYLNGWWLLSSYNVGETVTATKQWEGSWSSIQYTVKAGEQYKITGTGGVNGRLFCLIDASGVLQAVSPQSATYTDYLLDVNVDGTLYCSFIKPSAGDTSVINYSVVKVYGSFKEISSKGWKNGSLEFGRTCDCDYTSPEIERWSWANDEQSQVAEINALYDSLMAEHPQYITRVNCDEIMTLLGISKPDEIKDTPLMMYQFLPPRTPEASKAVTSVAHRIKVLIVTGTHPEYTSVWGCYNAMRLICKNWKDDKNLEELRWNADIYIIPCLNLYAVEHNQRPNENGVDINRNAPTSDWRYQGEGTMTFSGDAPASEYSTKAYIEMLKLVKPEVMIDYHATNVGAGDDEGDGKNMMYAHSTEPLAIDIAATTISQMTRKWKERYSDTFPTNEEDPTTIFGFSCNDDVPGSISKYATEQGSFGSTFESNFGILYKDKQYGTANRQLNTVLVNTCAVEGFTNYLVRTLKVYSEEVGV